MHYKRGFSLIELMIAVAIVGILAAIAVPSYNKSLMKSRRAGAQTFLLDVSQKEQQYLLDARTYVAASWTAAAPSPTALPGVSLPNEVGTWYTVAATVTTSATAAPTFTVTATPISGKKQAADGWIAIDSAGTKTSQNPGKW